jgi:D-serine deaminase-like pyridoxal phosphate-dependent protein
MWHIPTNESSISTPAVLVYPDRIEDNIRRMIAIAGTAQRLRPHVKTHKIAEVIQLQVQHGIKKFKCATLNEVEMVAGNGGIDILLAYPLLGPGVRQMFHIMERFPKTKLSVTVDSLSACRQLCDQASERGKNVNVFVDLDNGMHRTGIEPERAGDLIDFILDNKYLTFSGLHVYDGHIHDFDIAERKLHCDKDFEEVTRLIHTLEKKRVMVKEIACGGTPTFPIHAQYESRTLCAGTPLFWDAGYKKSIPDLDFLPAAVVVGRVISKPTGNICFDLGYKSIASEMAHPRLSFFNLEIDRVINHSEEHLVVSNDKSQDLSVGDLVYALPTHVCPTIALHEKVFVVQNQQVVDTWDVVARRRTYSH